MFGEIAVDNKTLTVSATLALADFNKARVPDGEKKHFSRPNVGYHFFLSRLMCDRLHPTGTAQINECFEITI